MLLIPTYIAPSKIDGFGLFAAVLLPAGTVWWRFDERIDRAFSVDEFDALPELIREHVRRSGYEQHGRIFMCGDDARFINHSTSSPSIPFAEPGYITTSSIFVRDVLAGEEITENYTQFDENALPFMRAAE